ncbi:MAG: biotin--[acetyl-CoA-carboxylase] ligase [Alphaproteobacteria bacterium]
MIPRPDLPSGYRLHALESIDSTNDEARRLAGSGAADRTVVVAAIQTAGHGRRGRSWVSPRGNVFCSILLRPAGPPASLAQLTFVAALATADAIAAMGVPARSVTLKWPNDVLLNGGKVAGILLEGSWQQGASDGWVVIGIGINLAHHPDGLPYPVTSVASAGGATGLDRCLGSLVAAIEVWLGRWEKQGFAPIRAAWWDRANDRFGPIRVKLDDSELEGRFAGIDHDGALILERPDGERRRIMAGDVLSARPAGQPVGQPAGQKVD